MSTPQPNSRRRSLTLTSRLDSVAPLANRPVADIIRQTSKGSIVEGKRRPAQYHGFGINPIARAANDGPESGKANAQPDATNADVPCSSNLSINIHSSDGFAGALTVTDINKIPWGRAGDIVEVRPARVLPDGGARGRTTGSGEPGRRMDPGSQKKERVKGNFLFKLRGNDEQQLRRLTAVSCSQACERGYYDIESRLLLSSGHLRIRTSSPSLPPNKSVRSYSHPNESF
jgi:hypothetical protein